MLSFLLAAVLTQVERPALATQAIVSARIEIGDGRVIESGTIVMTKGIIVAIGADAKAPPGAQVLDGKGLTVYPGFIDGGTTGGFKIPEKQASTDKTLDDNNGPITAMNQVTRPQTNPGLHPVEYLTGDAEWLKGYHKAGFTNAVLYPDPGIFRGAAGLINLNGKPKRESVLLPEVALAMRINASGEKYPATLLGAFSHARQTFLDAQRQTTLHQAYSAGQGTPPPYEPALEALNPYLSGSKPVLIEVDDRGRIEAVLGLVDEFHLKPILFGGLQAYKEVETLKRLGIPVVVAMDFGKDPIPEVKEETGDDPGDQDPLDDRQERQRKYTLNLANAATLERAGIAFAFTSRGAKDPSDFMSNLRKAVKAGLSRDGALKGLTGSPATLFGLGRQLGTLEVGKIANVTVLTGDFLDAKTKTKMLYIAGERFDPERGPDPTPVKPVWNRDGHR